LALVQEQDKVDRSGEGEVMQLAPLTDLQRQMIQAAQDLDAGKLNNIEDRLETLEHHARKVKDNTGQLREIMKLRIWNLYHLGQVLNELTPHGGSRFRGVNLDMTLMDLGINKNMSARARKIAAMDTEDIRTFIDESGNEINVSHLLRLHTESTAPPPEWDEEANWRTVRAVVRDFYDKAQDEERLNKCAEFLEE
jgi:hypothetical protein